MNKPKMIIFDYGQTLINERVFDAKKGTEAILEKVSYNPHNVSVEEIQDLANELNNEIGRYNLDYENQSILEVHNHIFQNYLYEYFGIQLTKPPEVVERIFVNAAIDMEPTKDIGDLLQFLEDNEIRTSVISNISFSGSMLKEYIHKYIPTNKFEFIIASSEYVFRKPHKRIFELALRKANLNPSEVWYCGDNAVFDVDGAGDSGIFPIWYKGAIKRISKNVPRREYMEVKDWNELIDIIKNLEKN